MSTLSWPASIIRNNQYFFFLSLLLNIKLLYRYHHFGKKICQARGSQDIISNQEFGSGMNISPQLHHHQCLLCNLMKRLFVLINKVIYNINLTSLLVKPNPTSQTTSPRNYMPNFIASTKFIFEEYQILLSFCSKNIKCYRHLARRISDITIICIGKSTISQTQCWSIAIFR